uniref:Leucine-rich repeat and WD repeat-containing protein 1 n=1 Tax=Gouania willdenowi TaxID=441366 RepID=A0A8C5NDM2_GOUWI
MEQITEKLLLEKGSPKTNRLEQIKSLNLSKLRLKLQDLPVRLLSRLQALERLDLSGNGLQEFPKSLKLPMLRFLDLSDNQMEDVTSLESLVSLEELKMEDNLYITVSDNYKLMVLLSNLRIYNGKDVSTNANHLRYVYSDNLRSRIVALWEKSFCPSGPITAEKVSALEAKFISTARQQVKFGPSSVTDFTKWKVEIIAKEFLCSLTEPKEKSSDSSDAEESSVVLSPVKRKQTQSLTDTNNMRLTPRKKPRSDIAAPSDKDSPRKSSLRLKPRTPVKADVVGLSPRASNLHDRTPTKRTGMPATHPKAKHACLSSSVDEAQRDADVLPAGSTKTVCLKPLHVLQCHSKADSSEDFSTQLWACAFQPLPLSTGSGGSRLVATCGGDSLCVIDCETGMVMKKYKVSGEEFFSLAWSTVLMSRGGNAAAQHCSILAAGGKRGLVKLIHPRNNVAYGEFRASRKSLSILRFNHQQGNFLFTGSYDNKILMWDIGGVDSQYNYKAVQLLTLEVSAAPLHICLPPASPRTHLLTACEDGLHCYSTQLGGNNSAKNRSKEMEINFPIYKKEDKEHDYHTIDGLSFLTDDVVASKNYLHGCIYLWSWSRTKAQRPDKKNRAVSAVVLAELQWANTEIPYLALNTCPGRMALCDAFKHVQCFSVRTMDPDRGLSLCAGQAYIVCGDDKGRLWTYHVSSLQKNSFQSGKPIRPTEVLEWPGPLKNGVRQVEGTSINSVAMDPELRYLVALSDKNMVIVWKRDESS